MPPDSCYPKIADGTLKPPAEAGWPKIHGVTPPPPIRMTYRLDFGPDFATEGLVTFEPPRIGKAFVGLVPAVDEDGNARAGIRKPLRASAHRHLLRLELPHAGAWLARSVEWRSRSVLQYDWAVSNKW